MPDLISIIRIYGLYDGKASVQSVTEALNTPSVEHRNDSEVTVKYLMGKFGAQRVKEWGDSMSAAGYGLAAQSMVWPGLSFTHPETVKMFAMLEQSEVFDAQTMADLRGVAVWHTSPWNEEGGDGQVSEQEVADALAVIANQDAIAALQQRLNVAMISASNVLGQGGTWDDAVAEIAKG